MVSAKLLSSSSASVTSLSGVISANLGMQNESGEGRGKRGQKH